MANAAPQESIHGAALSEVHSTPAQMYERQAAKPPVTEARPNEEISELSNMVKNLLTEQAELKDKLAAQERELVRVRDTGKVEKVGNKRVRESDVRNSTRRQGASA